MARIHKTIVFCMILLSMLTDVFSSVASNEVLTFNSKRTNNFISGEDGGPEDGGGQSARSSAKREAYERRTASDVQAVYASKILKMIAELIDLYRSSEPK